MFDANDQIVARWNAFPGGGMYPTRLWQPGEIFADEYQIPIALNARAGVGRIEASLFRRVPLANLTARDPQGNVVTPTIARFKIAGATNAPIENPRAPINFADQLALVGYTAPNQVARGDTLRVKLTWRALAAITQDDTVFIHLLDVNGKTVAQKDDQPQGGAYPTSFWDAGEIVADEYALMIPRDVLPGDYTIEIGLYRSRDGVRLSIRNDGDAARLGTVRVN